MPIEEHKKLNDLAIGKKETYLILIYYIAGIGSILYGVLSGNKYGHYFIILGFFTLLLMIFHVAVRTAEFNEKRKIRMLSVYINVDISMLVLLLMVFFVGLMATNGRMFWIDVVLLVGTGILLTRSIRNNQV